MTVPVARERIKLWADVLESLARDYKYAYGAEELHPVHKDLIDDMKEVTGEKKHTRKK